MAGPAGDDKQPQREAVDAEDTTENTPLLAREDTSEQVVHSQDVTEVEALSDTSDGDSPKKKQRRWWLPSRWPSFVALGILFVTIVIILVLGFIAPQIVKEYALQAVSYHHKSLSLDQYTESGVNVRLQGDIQLNSDLVRKKSVRDLGRFFTSVARFVESKDLQVEVSLPEYDATTVGIASVPGLVVDIRNKHVTHIDMLIGLHPGDKDGIKTLANDWMQGRLGQLRLVGSTSVALKSGGISFGTHSLSQELVIAGNELPTIPEYDLNKFEVEEVEFPDGKNGIKAEVSLAVGNGLPINVVIPTIGFDILVPNCDDSAPYIKVAEAATAPMNVSQAADIIVDAVAYIKKLPKDLTQTCPGSHHSPLDNMLSTYIAGEPTKVYIRGSSNPSKDTPPWIAEFLQELTVPVAVPGKKLGKLIKKFKLDDVHFSLPSPFADPGSPDSHPQISAKIIALLALPEEITFPIGIDRVKASATVSYKGHDFGDLDLNRWQAAKSERVVDSSNHTDLQVTSHVEKAPLTITNQTTFTQVLTDLITGSETVHLIVKAEVDAQVNTTLGAFVARKIPAQGDVPVKPVSDVTDPNLPSKMSPKLDDLRLSKTTEDSIDLSALMSFTNPTKYSAAIPYLSINVLVNDTVLGHTSIENVQVSQGKNNNLPFRFHWSPLEGGGLDGVRLASNFVSQYLSGYNTSITLQTSPDSLPSDPPLSHALAALKITLPVPKLGPPSDGDNDGDLHFVKSATMHILSSTSTFELASPFHHSSLFIPYLNASARYNNETIGHIYFDARNISSPDYVQGPIEVKPGKSETPRLKTEWNITNSAPEIIWKALGGSLRLGTRAEALLRLGRFEMGVWFVGGGLGVKIRL